MSPTTLENLLDLAPGFTDSELDELFRELEQVKRKRDEADDEDENETKKKKSPGNVYGETGHGKSIRRSLLVLPHTLGHSELASNCASQDDDNKDANTFSSQPSHMLGQSKVPPSSSLPQSSSFTSSLTICRTEPSSSEPSSSNNDANADVNADASSESDEENDIFTSSYRQINTHPCIKSPSCSPKSQPRRMAMPNIPGLSGSEIEWDTFKLQCFPGGARGSVCSFRNTATHASHTHKHPATESNNDEDTDHTDDQIEDVATEDEAIDLKFPDMESEEDPEDPDDYALSHWDEICSDEDDDEKGIEWKVHGMLTRGRARLVCGSPI